MRNSGRGGRYHGKLVRSGGERAILTDFYAVRVGCARSVEAGPGIEHVVRGASGDAVVSTASAGSTHQRERKCHHIYSCRRCEKNDDVAERAPPLDGSDREGASGIGFSNKL